jgi:hypothetical protein
MSETVNSVAQALQDYQHIATLSFYKKYQQFSKQYDLRIQKGVTQRRESQLRTIQDQETAPPFSYNIAK